MFAGCQNLVGYCRKYNSKVYLIPSSVDLELYKRKYKKEHNQKLITLGWVGNGAHYAKDLEVLIEPLTQIAKNIPVHLKIIGACHVSRIHEMFAEIPGLIVSIIDDIEWSKPSLIVKEISDFDIGLYPLIDNQFNDFKCGFKALEYMSVGIPVVASPNPGVTDIIANDVQGYIVNSSSEWAERIMGLISDVVKREEMGEAGRRIVEERYSTDVTANAICQLVCR